MCVNKLITLVGLSIRKRTSMSSRVNVLSDIFYNVVKY